MTVQRRACAAELTPSPGHPLQSHPARREPVRKGCFGHRRWQVKMNRSKTSGQRGTSQRPGHTASCLEQCGRPACLLPGLTLCIPRSSVRVCCCEPGSVWGAGDTVGGRGLVLLPASSEERSGGLLNTLQDSPQQHRVIQPPISAVLRPRNHSERSASYLPVRPTRQVWAWGRNGVLAPVGVS